MAYQRRGGWGGKRPGSGSKRGVPRKRRRILTPGASTAQIAAAITGLTDEQRTTVAEHFEVSALGDLGQLAKDRMAALLRDPAMPGARELLDAIRLMMTPAPRRVAAPDAPGVERKTFRIEAAK